MQSNFVGHLNDWTQTGTLKLLIDHVLSDCPCSCDVCLPVCLSACLSACAATVRYGDSSYYTRPSPASRFVTLTNTVSLQRGIDCLLQNIVRFGTSLRPKFRSLTKMYIAKGYAVSLHLLITKINSSLFHSNLPTSKYTLLQGHQKFRISNDRVLQR